MFGLFKSKTERMVLKLERLMIAVEHFYEKGKYDKARIAAGLQTQLIKRIHYDGDWSEEKIMLFLTERGLVRYINDEKYSGEMMAKLMTVR